MEEAQLLPGGSRRPADADGREIRGGFTVVHLREGRLTVSSIGYLVGEGEPYWIAVCSRAGQDGAHVVVRAAEVQVIDPPATAPAALPTDDLLHRLRELIGDAGVAALDPAHPRGVRPLPEWAQLFDELDYRMTRRAYAAPSQWRER